MPKLHQVIIGLHQVITQLTHPRQQPPHKASGSHFACHAMSTFPCPAAAFLHISYRAISLLIIFTQPKYGVRSSPIPSLGPLSSIASMIAFNFSTSIFAPRTPLATFNLQTLFYLPPRCTPPLQEPRHGPRNRSTILYHSFLLSPLLTIASVRLLSNQTPFDLDSGGQEPGRKIFSTPDKARQPTI